MPACPRALARLSVAVVAAVATLAVTAPVASSQARAPVTVATASTFTARPRPPKPLVLKLSYTVVRGDRLSSIARRHGVRLDTLRKLNRLRRTSVLRPGRVLRIPAIVIPGGLASRLPTVLRQRPERLRFIPLFLAAAQEFKVPADLLMAVAFRESNWNPAAVSRSGAMGVGQLLPGTVAFVSARLLRLPQPLDPWEPVDNIRMSARTLQYLLDLTGREPLRALAAYYQGYGSLTRQGVLPVGRAYAQSILALRPTFQP